VVVGLSQERLTALALEEVMVEKEAVVAVGAVVEAIRLQETRNDRDRGRGEVRPRL
jgi:hypothetical protein